MDFETLQRRLLARVRSCVQNGEMTERGLARTIGISQPHMHHILKGTRGLSLGNADRLLRRLEISVIDLLDGGDPAWVAPPQRARANVGMSRRESGNPLHSYAEGWPDLLKSSSTLEETSDLL